MLLSMIHKSHEVILPGVQEREVVKSTPITSHKEENKRKKLKITRTTTVVADT